jgi:hypothetical protein
MYISEQKIVDQGTAAIELRDQSTSHLNDQWICIPSDANVKKEIEFKDEDVRTLFPNVNYEPHATRYAFTNNICTGTGWCIAGGYASTYLKKGNLFFYIEGGAPKMCIRMAGDGLGEFQGISNNVTNAYIYGDQLYALMKKYPKIDKILRPFLEKPYHRNQLTFEQGRKKVAEYSDMKIAPPFVDERDLLGWIKGHKRVDNASKEIMEMLDVDNPKSTNKHRNDTAEGSLEGGNFSSAAYLRFELEEQNNQRLRDERAESKMTPEQKAKRQKAMQERAKGKEAAEAKKTSTEKYIQKACDTIYKSEDDQLNEALATGLYGFLYSFVDSFQNNVTDQMSDAFPYLTPEKIGQGENNPKFVDEAKKKLMNHSTLFEYHLNRFPFLKKDQDIQKKTIKAIKDALSQYANGDFKTTLEPNRLNNAMKGMPMKHLSVREAALDAFIYLIRNKTKGDRERQAFTDVSQMMSESGVSNRFKYVVTEKCIEALTKGNVELFNDLRVQFDLNEDIEGFKEEAFRIIVSGKGPNYLVNDIKMFESLDKFFNGRLREDETFQSIYEQALPIAATKLVSALGTSNETQIIDFFDRFPELSNRQNVLDAVTKNAANWMVGNVSLFRSIDKALNGFLTQGIQYDNIYQQAFQNAVERAKIDIETGSYEHLNELDEVFNNQLKINEEVFTEAKQYAAKYIQGKDNPKYLALNKAFRNRLKRSIEEIFDIVYENVRPEVLRAHMRESLIRPYEGLTGDKEKDAEIKKEHDQKDLRAIKRFDILTGGRVDQHKEELLGEAAEKASENATARYLQWEPNSLSKGLKSAPEPNPVVEFGKLNEYFGGRFLALPEIQERFKRLYNECLAYKGTPYFDETRKQISLQLRKWTGIKQVLSDEEISSYMQGRKQNAYQKAHDALQKGSYDELQRLVTANPEFVSDDTLFMRAKRRVRNYATSHAHKKTSIKIKREKVHALDVIFDGALMRDPEMVRLVNAHLGGLGLEQMSQQPESPEPQPQAPQPQAPQPQAPQPQEPQPQEPQVDPDAEAFTWYSLSKIG